MKKIILFMAMLACLVLGSALADEQLHGYDGSYVYVAFGQYPQSMDGGVPEEKNNTWAWASHTVPKSETVDVPAEPIRWRILTADEEKLYLVSEYVLFAMPTHTDVTAYKTLGTDFGNTQLSEYLNTVFLADAFNEEEQQLLLENGTKGKVFLLTGADVKNKKQGMGNGKGLKAWGTEYAIRVTGLFVYRTTSNCHSPYWVMDQASSDARHARCTKADGTLGHIIADRDNEGVRPAIYLDPAACQIVSGSGTKVDPYVLDGSSFQKGNE